MELEGRIVLVAGGGSGIGLGIALAMARQGCRVAICGRGAERLQEAAAQFDGRPPIVFQTCDLADRQDVGRLMEWLASSIGPPDIVVNSAGINVPKRRIAELDPADWDRVMAVNATGAFNLIHAVLPGMRQKKAGLIVNISSIAGKRALPLGGTAYCASKFAMSAMAGTISLEERANGIHITNIYPGEVNTPILAQRPTPVPPERLAQMLMPEDIAEMVVAIAKLPPRALVSELVMTPLYQEFA
jgi:NAD(P)-dependent dehydrogenase (short-subunit alcohol dehydrogenase family)